MNDTKYIIFRIGTDEFHYFRAAIFNGLLNHADIAEASLKHKAITAVSAGFCKIRPIVKCWGHSESMKLQANPEFDEQVIIETI